MTFVPVSLICIALYYTQKNSPSKSLRTGLDDAHAYLDTAVLLFKE